jgi:hypothetical protein
MRFEETPVKEQRVCGTHGADRMKKATIMFLPLRRAAFRIRKEKCCGDKLVGRDGSQLYINKTQQQMVDG